MVWRLNGLYHRYHLRHQDDIIQILHGWRENRAIYLPEVLAMDLSPRTRRVRGDSSVASTEGK